MQHRKECGDVPTDHVFDDVDDDIESDDILEEAGEDESVGYYSLLGESLEKTSDSGGEGEYTAMTAFHSDNTYDQDAIPTDYRSIVDNVLKQLNEEYTALMLPSIKQETEINQEHGISSSCSDIPDKGVPLSSSLDQEGNDKKKTSTDCDTLETAPALAPALVDPNRVQQAVLSLILRQDDKFLHKMDTGWNIFFEQHHHRRKPLKHCIIPSIPLAAFWKKTTKAIQATSNLTRSATLAEIMVRLNLLPLRSTVSTFTCTTDHHYQNNTSTITNTSSANFYSILTIHIVGADRVECSSPSTVQNFFCPFIRWMESFLHKHKSYTPPPSCQHGSIDDVRNIDEIHFILIGPNIPQEHDQLTVNLLPNISTLNDKTRVLKNATATCSTRLYHEYINEQQQREQVKKFLSMPSSNNDLSMEETLVVVAFNAGIWGYNDWSPTIQLLSQQSKHMKKKIPFIITAYTIEESVNDLDTMEQILQMHSLKGSILWNPEINPYHSRVPRITSTQPLTCTSTYHDNGAWQAWEFRDEE